ncbi:hypothetical protein CON36_37695, partial [Bacillus cereus]
RESASQAEYPESVDIKLNDFQHNPDNSYLMSLGDEIWAAVGAGDYGGPSYRKKRTWVPTEPSVDMNPDLATGNYYALKNPYEYK